jgi:hypothetical protein
MRPDAVREVAFEIGMPGRQGIDPADPDAAYTLRSLPGGSLGITCCV